MAFMSDYRTCLRAKHDAFTRSTAAFPHKRRCGRHLVRTCPELCCRQGRIRPDRVVLSRVRRRRPPARLVVSPLSRAANLLRRWQLTAPIRSVLNGRTTATRSELKLLTSHGSMVLRVGGPLTQRHRRPKVPNRPRSRSLDLHDSLFSRYSCQEERIPRHQKSKTARLSIDLWKMFRAPSLHLLH